MNINFTLFGLTRPGIEPEFTVSVADSLSTQALIDLKSENYRRLLLARLDDREIPLPPAFAIQVTVFLRNVLPCLFVFCAVIAFIMNYEINL